MNLVGENLLVIIYSDFLCIHNHLLVVGETAIVTFVPSNERKHFLVCCSEVSIILVSIADSDDIIDSMTRFYLLVALFHLYTYLS